ncbi:40S ribosomal protein SA [Fukomys damarensis]|uniref:40S ribosomal protein SA n=1 Tax=Fukomys damarensis TaxID=885580 RepID=A0A091CM81_FUKDA|nr:40S ribosomal protein SA [Fukomys damarensis]
MKEEDVLKFLAAGTHLGGTNLDFEMEQCIYKRKSDGIYTINLKQTWEKLLLAARAIVAIENPADVSVIPYRTLANSPLRYVDIAIPCNKGAHSVGLLWMLAQEVLRMRGTISREHPWEIMPDLYFYRDPEEIEKKSRLLLKWL